MWMQQPTPKFIGTTESRDKVAEIFCLESRDLLPNLPIEAIDTGLGHIVFGVRSLEVLMKVCRSIGPLKELCNSLGASEAQIFCLETYNPSMNLHTRNISPREGMEDPACGVGNSALLAYLMKNEIFDGNSIEIRAEQGKIVNMASVIQLRGKRDASNDLQLSIGGSGILTKKSEFLI